MGTGDVCGDGIVQQPNNANFNEQCDGINLTGLNCSQLDNYTEGSLGCTSRCQLDVRECVGPNEPECGDGVINKIGEECDEEDFGGRTCETLGYESGTLTCNEKGEIDECQLNKGGCVKGDNEYCGDGIVQQPNSAFFNEQCDGIDFTDKDCSDLDDYNFGSLSCTSMCYFDVTGCFSDWGFCNLNGTCDVGESCTCRDCNEEQDSCADDLVCSIINTVCCDNESDEVCTPYCATVDPDCVPKVCGDGILNYEEECDMGSVLNSADGSSGCFDNCTMSVVEPGEDGCPEGTELCADETCSLNCYYTDERKASCKYDGICSDGESCSCVDCNGEKDECADGLFCSFVDNACCNNESDKHCNPYCAYIDPDCNPEDESIELIGNCLYDENITDDCEDGVLEYFWNGIWTWDNDNYYDTSQEPEEDYVYNATTGKYHYDPTKSYLECRSGSNTIQCPVSALLPFFTLINIITILIAFGIIYYFLAEKDKKKKGSNTLKGIKKKRK